MPLPRVGSLEVAEDPAFERRSWRVERAGWALMALVVLAGLAGLFGGGPLSLAEESAGPLSVRYERFARMASPVKLEVRYGAEAVRDGELRIWIARRYLERAKLERAVPEARETIIDGELLAFVFPATPGQGGAVSFHLRFDGFGIVDGRAGAAGRQVAFRHLVYP